MSTCNRLDLQTLQKDKIERQLGSVSPVSNNAIIGLDQYLEQLMIQQNRQLVTDEPVEFLRNNQLKFIKNTGKLPIILEEMIEYTPNLVKENRRMSTCNRLDLQTLQKDKIERQKDSQVHCHLFPTNPSLFWINTQNNDREELAVSYRSTS